MVLQANSIYREVRDAAADVEAKLVEARSLLAEAADDSSGQAVQVVDGPSANGSVDDALVTPTDVSGSEAKAVESSGQQEQEEVIKEGPALPDSVENGGELEETADSAAES